jgi:hypothetical protein
MPEEEEKEEEEEEEEEKEGGGGAGGGGGGYSVSYSFLWYDTEDPSRGGIVEYNTLLDIPSSTSVPNICCPLDISYAYHEKRGVFMRLWGIAVHAVLFC